MHSLFARAPGATWPALNLSLSGSFPGLYELTDLDTPPHALAAHVDLARAAANEGAASLVNAVLRKAADLHAKGALPDAVAEADAVAAASTKSPSSAARARVRALAVSTSHPDWMVKRWLDRFGPDETAALLAWNNARPGHCLRVVGGPGASAADLAATLAEAGATVEPGRFLPADFVRVTAGLGAALAPGGPVATGTAQVQDEAAGLVVAAALDPRPGESVLDVAAAPGGKALYAAARMGGVGRLVARDVAASRLRPLETAAVAQGFYGAGRGEADRWDFLSIESGDGRAGPAGPDTPLFDRVLLDAPCSGTGVLAKRADLRWQRSPADLAELAALQDALLDGAAAWVRPGGLLVYSTCSLEPEENAARVEAFLGRTAGAGFTVEPVPVVAAGLPADLLSADGRFLEVLPHRHGADGAFAARLRRKEEEA